jgi:hypothetical protein
MSEDEDWEFRSTFIGMGVVGSAMVAPLQNALKDNRPHVRARATFVLAALARHGKTDPAPVRDLLRRMLRDDAAVVRRYAVMGYEWVPGSGSDVALVLDRLEDTDEQVRESVPLVVRRVDRDGVQAGVVDREKIADGILKRTQHADAYVRVAAWNTVLAIGNLQPWGRQGDRLFTAITSKSDYDTEVERHRMFALGAIFRETPSAQEKVLPLLRMAILDRDRPPEVRAAAVAAYPPDEADSDVVRALVEEIGGRAVERPGGPVLAQAACTYLSGRERGAAERKALPALLALVRDEKQPESLRTAALWAVRRLGSSWQIQEASTLLGEWPEEEKNVDDE